MGFGQSINFCNEGNIVVKKYSFLKATDKALINPKT